VEADLLVSPVEGPHGGLFHGGFLSAVRDDTTLHAQLARHAAGSAPLYLLGHSLGGALAMVMLHANLIPPAHTGAITCVALGSPKVSLGRPPPNSRPSRLLLLVNAQDTVPRLLGSPMVVLQAALQVLATKGSARGNQVAMPTNDLISLLSDFEHPEDIELLYLVSGTAKRVPRDPASREAVLHLADGLAPWVVRDHLTYVEALEAALVTLGGPPAPPGYNLPPAPLPPGWRSTTAANGREYYYNEHTRATSWTRPA